ncbi:MAG: amidohydrolase family protein [Gemmatimonadota bacterium]|nr:amidohydrolase family protein [Gemmatimonadota bacterium]
MIYDGHAYCFPAPDEIGGFDDRAEFHRHLQLFMAQARQQPVWRRGDRALADTSGLYDPDWPWRFEGLREADFRTGKHGLAEWTVDGEDYVKQALPPWTEDFSFSSEYLVAEMDYAGVDRALLHRTPYMGLDDDYIAECCRRYPERIQGLAQIPEWWIPDRIGEAIAKLERAIGVHGLSGLQFAPFHRPLYDLSAEWSGPDFDPFWTAVARLEIPVFFTLGAVGSPSAYMKELRSLRAWMDRFPDVDVIVTHGFPWRMFAEGDRINVPDEVYAAAPSDHPRFHIQILFAVFLQSRWDYPMPQMRPVLETMVERFGADRILWGTDIPIVLLHWTYRQSLDYVRRYCPFLDECEMEAILGGNMERIMEVGRFAG